MGIIVIVASKPKKGKEAALDTLIQSHVPLLRKLGLATSRAATSMKSSDGTVLEVFEWLSQEAISMAHENSEVIEMWNEFAQVCDFVPIATLAESTELFAEFTALN